MGQKKLQRFAEIATFPNVLQYPQGMAGKWTDYFNNNHPLIMELACGKGEYAVGLGRLHPENNYIGMDLKGNRIWVGAKKALADGLNNVAFLRSHIDKITDYFNAGEVSEIWITFPDPQLRVSRAKKRLTHPRFLRLYKQILQHNGIINLKTDSPVLIDFTRKVIELYQLEQLEYLEDLASISDLKPELQIKTHYEGLDISGSNKIYYLRFRISNNPDPGLDEKLHQLLKEEPGIEVKDEEQ
ncbi:tRNA (guanosine(46)-N7)-methyltransferase TrmB [Pollutibacter soli]|uniref:tRNA (guanosine(46)-N7)-methyltransferase TrmB n=1 Tax=Pollutibacter soli TaxID=3034157 RepID=UPI00301323E0